MVVVCMIPSLIWNKLSDLFRLCYIYHHIVVFMNNTKCHPIYLIRIFYIQSNKKFSIKMLVMSCSWNRVQCIPENIRYTTWKIYRHCIVHPLIKIQSCYLAPYSFITLSLPPLATFSPDGLQSTVNTYTHGTTDINV